jgi:hypothetical protein
MKYLIAPIWFASFLEKASVSRTRRETRCRIVKDRIRLWKQGVRDLVMELCCALHNFRVRLNPWLPMI